MHHRHHASSPLCVLSIICTITITRPRRYLYHNHDSSPSYILSDSSVPFSTQRSRDNRSMRHASSSTLPRPPEEQLLLYLQWSQGFASGVRLTATNHTISSLAVLVKVNSKFQNIASLVKHSVPPYDNGDRIPDLFGIIFLLLTEWWFSVRRISQPAWLFIGCDSRCHITRCPTWPFAEMFLRCCSAGWDFVIHNTIDGKLCTCPQFLQYFLNNNSQDDTINYS